MGDDFRDSLFVLVAAVVIPLGVVVVVVAADYSISAKATVDTVNEQCGTRYATLDYLRVGKEVMLQVCETRQKRVELLP